jgi:hypothetical protein
VVRGIETADAAHEALHAWYATALHRRHIRCVGDEPGLHTDDTIAERPMAHQWSLARFWLLRIPIALTPKYLEWYLQPFQNGFSGSVVDLHRDLASAVSQRPASQANRNLHAVA